jgi:hypothetical protein
MTKNKLLTIPIEEEKRERLNKYCADAGTTVSQFITKYIDAVLDGSIEIRESIDIEGIVEKVIDELKFGESPIDARFVSVEEFDKAMAHNALVIADFAASMGRTDLKVEKLQKFTNYSEAEQVIDIPIEQPIEQSMDIDKPIDTSVEPRTLDDTKRYLQSKNDYNRSRSSGSKKISQSDMAFELNNYQYPHPDFKSWTRTEVSKVCKLWKLTYSPR